MIETDHLQSTSIASFDDLYIEIFKEIPPDKTLSQSPHIQPIPAPASPPQFSDIYCICKGKDDGSLMIQCNQCIEWFHIACVKLTSDQAQKLKNYSCPNCSEPSKVGALNDDMTEQTNDLPTQPIIVKDQTLTLSQSNNSAKRFAQSQKASPNQIWICIEKKEPCKKVSPSLSKMQQSTLDIRENVYNSFLTILQQHNDQQQKRNGKILSLIELQCLCREIEDALFANYKELSSVSTDTTESSQKIPIAAISNLSSFVCSFQYKTKFRSLAFNLKDIKNSSLRQSLIDSSISPTEFVRMSPEQLANQDITEEIHRMRRESINATLINDDLYDVSVATAKKTHKGEILISKEQASHLFQSQQIMPKRATVTDELLSTPDSSLSNVSVNRETNEENQCIDPTYNESINSSESISLKNDQNCLFEKNLASCPIRSKGLNTSELLDTINIETVSVTSSNYHVRKNESTLSEPHSPPRNNRQNFQSIRDKHFSYCIDIPCVGKVKLYPIQLTTIAKDYANEDKSSLITDLHSSLNFPFYIPVVGRIDSDRADQYLYSMSKHILIYQMNTSNPDSVSTATPILESENIDEDKHDRLNSVNENDRENKHSFIMLFNHLKERGRYGVLGRYDMSKVRDSYLVPVAKGTSLAKWCFHDAHFLKQVDTRSLFEIITSVENNQNEKLIEDRIVSKDMFILIVVLQPNAIHLS